MKCFCNLWVCYTPNAHHMFVPVLTESVVFTRFLMTAFTTQNGGFLKDTVEKKIIWKFCKVKLKSENITSLDWMAFQTISTYEKWPKLGLEIILDTKRGSCPNAQDTFQNVLCMQMMKWSIWPGILRYCMHLFTALFVKELFNGIMMPKRDCVQKKFILPSHRPLLAPNMSFCV